MSSEERTRGVGREKEGESCLFMTGVAHQQPPHMCFTREKLFTHDRSEQGVRVDHADYMM